ncbi:HutD/Ves family protein [Streptomyces sp. H27-D2]|uniref:HutD/Ves family protein n=1 Tax=Streptomyces sp. H27-D2 TaxID=3046304 RepID=UPI002DBF64D4|nr:HutD family protein [Streptomyces sp. H27-D2]MEC4015313.1 HutD family protein [Streptomyces sp. H27-D2]
MDGKQSAAVQVLLLRAGDRRPVPWANGGGVTREVAAGPAGAALADFDWRVSLADVARDGPYSPFAEVDRIITVVEGPGMTLTVDGGPPSVIEPYAPYSFPGNVATDCRLVGGPIVNLNVMVRRARAAATVEIVRDDRDSRDNRNGRDEEPQTLPVCRPGVSVLVVALAGSTTLDTAGSGATAPAPATLARFDAALLTTATPATLRTDGLAAVITLTDLSVPLVRPT